MKKGKIALAAIIAAMTAISMANAETTSKSVRNSPKYPDVYPAYGSEGALQTENCCGHKVPKGTCMAVCLSNQFPDLEQTEDGATASTPATLENLTGTTERISSINMEKNFSEAGSILASFYSGSKAKDNSDSVVYAGTKSVQSSSAKTEKEICNAKPSKIILAGKVPMLGQPGTNNSRQEKNDLPATSAGMLAAGALALGLAGRKKGYFSNYGEDCQTVWNYVTGNDNNSGSSSPQSGSQTASTNTVVNVNNSSGTITTSTSTDNTCSQGDPSCYGSGYIHHVAPPYPRP